MRKKLFLGNGESLGQVASQTLQHVRNTSMPIIRPVATLDIDIAKDTYDISIRPYEDCCTIVPESIRTQLKKCHQYESNFDFETLVEECIENTEIITIKAGEFTVRK